MQKKFITNLAFLLFLNLLIKPFWILGIDRAVQNTVGAESYGLYSALFNLSFLFNIILDVGITNYNNRNIAMHNHLLEKHLSGIIMLRLVLALAYTVISLGVAWILGYQGAQLWMLLVMLINQALISFILYLRSNIAGLQLFKIDSVISVLDRAIMIIICSFLIWGRAAGSEFKIEWFIWAQTLAYVVTVIITFIIVAKKAKLKKLQWNPTFFYIVLKHSYPFAILILLMTFYNRIDSVMLERLLPNGAEQAGIYAQSYRLLDASNMIAYLFSGLLLPMFSHMIKKKQSLQELAELSFSFISVPAIALIGFCFFFSHNIMGLLYHAHVEASSEVFKFVMCCFLAISSVYIFGTMLTATGNLKYLNIIALSGMVLNIVLNLILIPRFQSLGAAYSSMITQFTSAGLQIILAHKVFGFKFKKMLAVKYVVYITTTFYMFYIFSNYPTNWFLKGIAGGVICLLIALGLKLIKPLELVRLLKSEQQ